MYKSFFIFLCATTLIYSASVYSQVKQKVTLGYFVMKPYAYTGKDGKSTGVAIDFLRNHISQEMNVVFKFVEMPLARILYDMNYGSIDGIVILGYTAERAAKHSYTQHSMQTSSPVLSVRHDSPLVELPTSKQLKDLRIGYVKDAILSDYMNQYNISLDLIHGNDTWVRNIERLLKQRVDAVYAPLRANMISAISDAKATEKVRMIDISSDVVELYTIFSAHPSLKYKNLVESYDNAFTKIDGKILFDKIFKAYIKTLKVEQIH